jgi:hypothetical protein
MTDSDDAATDEPFLIVIRSESCAARTVLAAGGGCYLLTSERPSVPPLMPQCYRTF